MKFDLVTPQKLMMSTEASYVEVSGEEGSFGVLDGHSPLISTLKPGLLRAETAEGEACFFVEEGFAEVSPDSVTILAEEATSLDSLDAEALKAEIEALKKEFAAEAAETVEKRILTLTVALGLAEGVKK